uniref:Uncharacterized protein n=1 Tax=uncultured marine microorganism HF4000_010I05 TaxID=455517 RepID=B3T1K3_9ZZZZ|nr:hypothetical protein ALOHA_HF4000010I05ctg1g26 [uncultured marine microorganism HF4000_010I05]
MSRKAQKTMKIKSSGTTAYMLRTPHQLRVRRRSPVIAGPRTSPMLPPTPCIERAEPRRAANRCDKAAAAGRCHIAAAAATAAIPSKRIG